jgi:stage IV sporulation protein FB
MYQMQEPPPGPFELRFNLLGIRYRVSPSFWIISALLAYLFIGDRLAGIVVDVACIFFAIVFTEFIQGMVYRSYGIRALVHIKEFGGGIYPEREPPMRLQRIVVELAKPASCFILAAAVYYSNESLKWQKEDPLAGFAYFILLLVSLFWGIISLLPIFPYPMGKVVMEIATLISPRNGLPFTLIVSIVIGIAYIAYAVGVYFRHVPELILFNGLPLPASIIAAVFFGLSVMMNFQLLKLVLAARKQYVADDYGDRAPWDNDDYEHRSGR